MSGGIFTCEVVFSAAPKHGHTTAGQSGECCLQHREKVCSSGSGFGAVAVVSCLKVQAAVAERKALAPVGQGFLPSAAVHPTGGSWLHISLSSFSLGIK